MGLDGTLYTLGGVSTATQVRAINNTAPASAAWSTKQAMTSAMAGGCIACTVADGRILLMDVATTAAIMFTPGTPGSWASVAAMPAAVSNVNCGAWLLPNTHVVVYNGSTTWMDLDVAGNTWSSPTRQNLSPSLPYGGISRQADAQGRSWFVKNRTLQSYTFATDTITDTGVLAAPGIPCPLPDGRVVLFGINPNFNSPDNAAQAGDCTGIQIVGG